MAGSGQTAVTLYPVGNYNFGVKAPIIDKDATFEEALARMQQKCAATKPKCFSAMLRHSQVYFAAVAMSLLCFAHCSKAFSEPKPDCCWVHSALSVLHRRSIPIHTVSVCPRTPLIASEAWWKLVLPEQEPASGSPAVHGQRAC